MAYRLNSGEAAPAGIRRIAVEELESAARGLRDPGADRDEAIHEARKTIKKVRALIRLARADLGAVGRAENRRLRSAARKISALRDAGAMLEFVDSLVGQASRHAGAPQARKPAPRNAALDPRVIEGIRRGLRARKQETDAQSLITQVAAVLEKAAKQAPSWPLEANGFQNLSPGLRRIYRDGRRAMARAATDPADANFHEWRKRAKDHWYHVRLLAGVLKKIEPRAQALETLSELLGDHQNLVVLRAQILADRRSYGRKADVDAFLKLLDERQAALRQAALASGRRLYRQKPRKFVQGIESLWPAGRTRAAGRG
jgi:CHAD domain-containing protein